jgi:hypothetical protein
VLAKCVWQQDVLAKVDAKLRDWWIRRRKAVAKARRKAFDSLVFLVFRSLWLERNARVSLGSLGRWHRGPVGAGGIDR